MVEGKIKDVQTIEGHVSSSSGIGGSIYAIQGISGDVKVTTALAGYIIGVTQNEGLTDYTVKQIEELNVSYFEEKIVKEVEA